MMRKLFFIAILFSVKCAFSQAVKEAPAYNNNANQNNTLILNSNSEAVSDTIVFEEKEVLREETISTKKSKAAYRSASEDLGNQGSESEKSNNAIQTFSVSKSSSAYSRTQRTPSPQYQQQMDAAVDQLEKSSPESFEYHFYSYLAGNYNVGLVDHLNEAEKLRPNNSDVHIQKAAFHIINCDTLNSEKYIEKLVSSSRLSEDVRNYSEDVLLSVGDQGTLITHGFDDSFGTLYQQVNNEIRKDVTIVSLDLVQSEKYRSVLKEKGYLLPERTNIDVVYLSEFCRLNSSRNLAISMTVPREYLNGISDKLFTSGLVFEYHSESNYNNFNRNDELWFSLLKKKGIENAVTEKGRQLSANYLPMLLHLSQVYGELNEPKKKMEIDTAIDAIAVQSNKYEQVKKLKGSY